MVTHTGQFRFLRFVCACMLGFCCWGFFSPYEQQKIFFRKRYLPQVDALVPVALPARQ